MATFVAICDYDLSSYAIVLGLSALYQPFTTQESVIAVATGLDDFDNRIRDLAKREKECDTLFEEIKNGRGEASLRYLTLRDFCKELRKEIFRTAKSAGLTRERIKQEMSEARTKLTLQGR